MTLLLAGHETTTGSLGNALVALGRHPDQRDLVGRKPELWPNAVEELLRFDPVVHTDPRAAFDDVAIGGRTIKKLHRCRLVRTEMRVALPALLRAFGDYVIVEDQLEWKKSIAFRGPSRLRIRC